MLLTNSVENSSKIDGLILLANYGTRLIVQATKVPSVAISGAEGMGWTIDSWKYAKSSRAANSKKSICVRDQYNPIKTWIISRSSCRHYHVGQMIANRVTTAPQRFPLAAISFLVDMSAKEIKECLS